YVNLDVRAATNIPSAHGRHRFAVGSQKGAPAVEILIEQNTLTIITGHEPLSIPLPKPGDWQNLQLVLDLQARTFSGGVGLPMAVTSFTNRPLSAEWNGVVDSVAI